MIFKWQYFEPKDIDPEWRLEVDDDCPLSPHIYNLNGPKFTWDMGTGTSVEGITYGYTTSLWDAKRRVEACYEMWLKNMDDK
jgi:hypothetical protein